MNSIAGVLGFIILAILFGKRSKRVHLYSFLVIMFLALFELVVILIQVYTMARPSLQ
jgi:F0F1-type ATP synthase membrane subunit a